MSRHSKTQLLWIFSIFVPADAYPGKWQWQRRWIGGKWELWENPKRSGGLGGVPYWFDVEDLGWTPLGKYGQFKVLKSEEYS